MLPAKFLAPPVKPRDFVSDETLCSEKQTQPKMLQECSGEEKACILKKKILAVANKRPWPQKKAFKREESMWDADLSRAEGPFDGRGSFSAAKSTPVFSWLVRRDEVQGPFSEREMRVKIEQGELEDALVKRDTDRGFLHYKCIAADLGDFLSSEALDEYFERNAVAEKASPAPQEFFDNLSSLSLKKSSRGDRSKVLEGCVLSKRFLHVRNPTVGLSYLENRIAGKTFSEAVDVICKCAGLSHAESEELLNLFLDESKLSVLSDVCPDGFVKAPQPRRRK